MPLTTVPPDDAQTIYSKVALKVVVLGSDKQTLANLVNTACQNATHGVDRYAIWLKDSDLEALAAKFPGLGNLSGIKAFALSTINKVAYKMPAAEVENSLNADAMFIKAGKTKFNQ